ncbi:hypothetical protein D9981_09665, partial [Pseudoalteromonas phenolica O-BC30]
KSVLRPVSHNGCKHGRLIIFRGLKAPYYSNITKLFIAKARVLLAINPAQIYHQSKSCSKNKQITAIR